MRALNTYRRATFALGAAFLLVTLVAIAVPAGFRWDFGNFYDAGQKVVAWELDGLYDPTSLIEGSPPHGAMTFWGTPLSALLYAPLGALPPAVALVIFKIVNAACIAGTLLMLFRLYAPGSADEAGRWRYSAALLGTALVFQPLWAIYRVGGQTTPVILLLLTSALVAHVAGRTWLPALSLVCVVAIKPAFVFLLAAICLLSGWRMIRATALLGGGLAGVSVLLMGWPVHATFLQRMSQGLGTQRSWVFNSSLYVAADSVLLDNRWGLDPAIVSGCVLLGRLAIVGLFGWLWWRLRSVDSNPAGRRHMAFILALWFGLAISTIVWEHYLELLLPLIAFALAEWQRLERADRAIALALLAASLWQNVTFTSFVNARIDPASLGVVLVLAALKSATLLLATVFLWRAFGVLTAASSARSWVTASLKRA